MITGKGTAKNQASYAVHKRYQLNNRPSNLSGNQAYCSLTFFDEPGRESIEVLSFQGTNHSLCQHYQFIVEVTQSSNSLTHLHLGKRISLNINLNLDHVRDSNRNRNRNRNRNKTFRIDGYLTTVSNNTVVMESPLYLLMLHRRCKVYRNLTIPELIAAILTQVGWSRENYELHLLSNFNYPIIPTLTQYNMTDLDFLEKNLSCWGFIYYFRQDYDDDFCKLIITDELIPYNQHTRIRYCSSTAMIADEGRSDSDRGSSDNDGAAYCLQTELIVCAENVVINNYDYQQPKQNLQLESKNASGFPGHGVQYCYGEPYTTIQQGLHLLNIRQQALDCQRYRLSVKTNAAKYQPGDVITIQGLAAYSRNKNNIFRIIAIKHNASQREHGNNVSVVDDHADNVNKANDNFKTFQLKSFQRSLNYSNTLDLIEINCPFRPNYRKYHQNHTNHHNHPNFYQIATIENIPDHEPYLDEQGRYRIRYPFDQSNPQGEASEPLRLMQPHTGNKSGHHWPLHHGTQVIIGFVNHDIDRPFIVGTLPNNTMPSPVTAYNPHQHILRSYAGNELLMDDDSETSGARGISSTGNLGNPKIRLSTPLSQQSVVFDSSLAQPQIRLNAHVGDIQLRAGHESSMLTKANLHHTIHGNHTIAVDKNYSLQTQHGDINLQAGNDAKFSAKKSISLNTAKKNIVIKSGEDTLMHSQRGFNWTINKGNFTLINPDGQLKLQAKNNLSISNQGSGEYCHNARSW